MNKFLLKQPDLNNQVYNPNPPEIIQVGKGGILVCDPILLSDVFNESECEIANYICKYGQIFDCMAYGDIYSFGNDIVSCIDDGLNLIKLSDEIGTDSHSILIMPYESKLVPKEIKNILKGQDIGFHYNILKVNPGRYKSFVYDFDENGSVEDTGFYIKFID